LNGVLKEDLSEKVNWEKLVKGAVFGQEITL
jgi:hypothetical protein